MGCMNVSYVLVAPLHVLPIGGHKIVTLGQLVSTTSFVSIMSLNELPVTHQSPVPVPFTTNKQTNSADASLSMDRRLSR